MKTTQTLTKSASLVITSFILVLGLFCLQNSETRADPPRSKYPYLPIITEISLFTDGGKSPWIEFFNPLEETVDASELKIVINDTLEYSFPEGLPPLPSKGFILLRLDGKGEKGEGFRNEGQSLVLHSPRVCTCAMKCIGQIAIYQKVAEGTTKLVGFVSWGAPGSKKSSTPERNIIWKPKWFVGMSQGPDDYDPGAIIKAGYSIGLYPGFETTGMSDWVVFSKGDASPSRENIVPRPSMFIPSDGKVRCKDPSVRWVTNKYAKTYRFQIASKEDFSSIVGDTILEAPVYRPGNILSEGTYYYRVKTIDINSKNSDWSETMKLNCIDCAFKDEKILKGMVHMYQRKDTNLLCLDGCYSDLDSSTIKPWDNCNNPKVDPDCQESKVSSHNDTNCAHASISMMVYFYGKSLSQDRIAYYMEEEVPCQDRIAYYRAEERPCQGHGKPEGDLAHKKGMRYFSSDGGEETIALKWALGEKPYRFLHHSPTFNQLREWLDAGRPIMTRCKKCLLYENHVRVIDGYRVFYDLESGVMKNEVQSVHILDPFGYPTHRWEEFETWDSTDEGTWVGPKSAPNAREDEESIWIDSDNDGIMDFDEQNRFFTDPFKKDSDNDGIDDKDEIRKYVFKGYKADTDGDDVRKELDPDE